MQFDNNIGEHMSRGGFVRLASMVFALVMLFALTLTGCGEKDKKVKTASGLVYEDIKVGSGAEAVAGKMASVRYTGWLADGKKFGSSGDTDEPFIFPLGVGHVIKGLDEGVLGMKAGGVRKVTMPPPLAYGEKGVEGAIPPNATLTFEIELVDVK
jgi:FKBP-type peptidyl-prolyl cis-trans isomerase FkpA